MKLFTHGALLYGVITSDIDCDHLQDLRTLEQWQNLWQMEFNREKFKILCISNKRCHAPQIKYMFYETKLMEQVRETNK